MKVKDLEFLISFSQRCYCIIRYRDLDKDDREVVGPFGSIYHVISRCEVIDIYTTIYCKRSSLGFILQGD